MKWWLIAWREIRWEVFLDRASLLRTAIFVLVPMLLIFKQPDLGTALVLMAIWFGMTFIAGARPIHLILIVLTGAILFMGRVLDPSL